MQAHELTDEDIGSYIWVKGPFTAWTRVLFEGLHRRLYSTDSDDEARNGGPSYWLILRCAPCVGSMYFTQPDGQGITGILIRSTAEIWPVQVDWAVGADGEILEIGERAA